MNSSSASSVGNDDAWIVVEDEEPELAGMTLAADRESGDIVSLSTRSCRSEQKRRSMPSLEEYPHLRVVDLYNYRNMTDLHESICHLPVLQKLIISRCDFLTKLPPSIGKLENLVEVSLAGFSIVSIRLTSRQSSDILFFSILFFSRRSLIFLILSNYLRFLKVSLDVKGELLILVSL